MDRASFPLYQSRVWHISDSGYVVWRGIENNIKKTIRFHRVVIGAKQGQEVDHINRNKLDNRRSNLRFVTRKENTHNSDRYNNAKGYYYDNRKKRWTVDSRRIGVHSVYVDSEQDAQKYVQAVLSGKTPLRKFTKRMSLGRAKMDNHIREQIDNLFAAGVKRYKIAEQLGLSPSAIGRYLSGKTWRNNKQEN